MLKDSRPVSFSPLVSKIYKRIVWEQFLEYVGNHLFPHMYGYRKGYSIKTTLIPVLEKWRLFVDKKLFFKWVLMDLSKTFAIINNHRY